jgi:uncharacterized protein (TIGR02444 family)
VSQTQEQDNPLWEFSLRLYDRGEVAQACLALQDAQDADVNLLLYAIWLAQGRQRLTPGHLAEARAAVTPWRERVIRPLRGLRRQLRDFPPASSIRAALQRVELDAEREQQDLLLDLWRRSPPPRAQHRPLRENLAMLAGRGTADPLWEQLIARVAAAAVEPSC